jgi:hypothetical protein
MAMETITLNTFCHRDKDGFINLDATMSKFKANLKAYIEEKEAEHFAMLGAVDAVFDKYNGASISIDALVGLVAIQLNATPTSYKSIAMRIRGFIKINSQMVNESNGSMFTWGSHGEIMRGPK